MQCSVVAVVYLWVVYLLVAALPLLALQALVAKVVTGVVSLAETAQAGVLPAAELRWEQAVDLQVSHRLNQYLHSTST